jgi:ribosomal protein S12 methylthiotransferase accessory factor YcaO
MTGLGDGLKSLKRKLDKALRELHKMGVKNVWEFTWSTGIALPVWMSNREAKRQVGRSDITTANVNGC